MKSNKKLTIILGVIIAAVIISTYLVSNLLYGSNVLIFKINPAVNLISQVRNAEKTGDTLYLKPEDLNGILELYSKKLSGSSSINIEGCYSTFNDNKISLFIPVKFHSIRLLLSSSGSITYENNSIKFTPDSFNIGKIKVSKQFVFTKLKGYAKDGLSVNEDSILMNKNILPFDFTALAVINNTIEVNIQKLEAKPNTDNTQAAQQDNSPAQGANKPSQTQQEKNAAILKRASQQLKKVYSALKTDEGRQIISTIQAVVNKMVQNPSYSYKAEADAVKTNYSKLSDSQRNDIKDAILNYMDIDSLRTLKNTFGL